MKTFHQYLEELKLKNIETPRFLDDYYKIFRISPNDKQSRDSWLKKNSRHIYQYPLNKEKFIHFAPASVISSILDEKVLKGNNGAVFAISTTFGNYVPGVQYRIEGTGKMKGKVAGAPRGVDEVLGAVIFQTDVLPIQGGSTEVVWEGNFLPVKDVKEINYRLAISILKNSPLGSKVKWNDDVEYY